MTQQFSCNVVDIGCSSGEGRLPYAR